jgi:hypothetical protein
MVRQQLYELHKAQELVEDLSEKEVDEEEEDEELEPSARFPAESSVVDTVTLDEHENVRS